MDRQKLKSKNKIFKQAEILGAIISGIEEVKPNHYMRMTPFTKSLSLKNVTPHVHTIKGRLTEGFLWQETFNRYNIEFDLDDNGFVVGFKVRDKKRQDEEIKVGFDRIEKRLTALEQFYNIQKEKNAK